MAVVLVLEPIFEADLQPEQYAYRPGRSALDAVKQVHGLLNTGHTEVVDITKVQAEPKVQPHRVADDLDRKPVIVILCGGGSVSMPQF